MAGRQTKRYFDEVDEHKMEEADDSGHKWVKKDTEKEIAEDHNMWTKLIATAVGKKPVTLKGPKGKKKTVYFDKSPKK